MKTITEAAAAIKYFEAAIEMMRENITREVENDKDISDFENKIKEINRDFIFIFCPHTLKFRLSMSKFAKNGSWKSLEYFQIINGKVEFSKKNSFEGIEEIAQEAQKITQKYFKKED
ncbi:MAG TPA: hypothetical protein VLZ29_04475 [Sulfurimonas sp.]|uniref:hypothetical protein n=1 Tax=Sulfurimonas sp. TaxID=2022749 RepID=UPI002D0C8BD8|nr:hypothetical protein [Sulfurimonas sp.]HUH42346.1 hypothetical protein [Sulfurimonas sp.]